LLEMILCRLDHLACHGRDAAECEKQIRSVEAAREELAGITPAALAEFVSAWRYDLYRWNARLHGLPHFTRLPEAFAWLGIADVRPGSQERTASG
jgi:hypothetical protein